jgi:subtilisin-like proprotein convertase family protein
MRNSYGLKLVVLFSATILCVAPIRAFAQGCTATAVPAEPIPILDDNYDGSQGVAGNPTMACLTASITDIATVDQVSVTLTANHTWIGDLVIKMESPSGTQVTLMSRPGLLETGDGNTECCGDSSYLMGGANPINFFTGNPVISENMGAASGAGVGVCATTGECFYEPNAGSGPSPDGGFLDFIGEPTFGDWTVCMGDGASADTGEFESLEVSLSCTILPVELVSFEATVDADVAVLKWITASEENNAGFEIEMRGADNTFEPIAFVQGAGTTTEQQQYVYRVENLEFGRHVFRLKQIDFDGTTDYSDEVEVSRELAEGFALRPFYPNPFNPQGTYSVMIAQDQIVDIQVYDILGRSVATLHKGELLGQRWHTIPFRAADNLPSGTYVIHAAGEFFAATQKVMLAK